MGSYSFLGTILNSTSKSLSVSISWGDISDESNSQSSIRALLTSVPSFSFGSGFSDNGSIFSQGLDKISQLIPDSLKTVHDALSQFGMTLGKAQTGENVFNTFLVYQGGERFSMNLDMVFLRLSVSDSRDFNRWVSSIQSLLKISTGSLNGLGQFVAPLGYNFNLNLNSGSSFKDKFLNSVSVAGTVTVRIGKWFRMSGLVVKDVSLSFSSEIMTDGLPLYAEATVSLESWKAFDLSGLQRCFNFRGV